jgi:subtilisin-like proprotein convertase family protein
MMAALHRAAGSGLTEYRTTRGHPVNQHPSACLTRSVTNLPSRRELLRGVGAAALVMGLAPLSELGEAKKKKRKKRRKHKKLTKSPKRTTVTLTFSNTQFLAIPGGTSTNQNGPADPYPASIAVSGLRNGKVTDINLIITDLTHSHYDDLDILLTSPDGRQALVMSDVADVDDVDGENINLVLDDEAAASLPGKEDSLRSGTFRPTNIDRFPDLFAPPAPALNGNVALSTFDGADPNGTWQLWVMDNSDGDRGDIGSWELQITAEVDA